MITKRTWEEFRNNGLLLFINQILHVFGWAIVTEIDNGEIINVYPARVKFRGFDNDSVSKCYCDLSRYMMNNGKELYEESCIDIYKRVGQEGETE